MFCPFRSIIIMLNELKDSQNLRSLKNIVCLIVLNLRIKKIITIYYNWLYYYNKYW